jgi:hypothetical protein
MTRYKKVKVITVIGHGGPQGCDMSRLPYFLDNQLWPLYPRREEPITHWTGGWVGPRNGLDDIERRKILTLLGLVLLPFGIPAHRSCYTNFLFNMMTNNISNNSVTAFLLNGNIIPIFKFKINETTFPTTETKPTHRQLW